MYLVVIPVLGTDYHLQIKCPRMCLFQKKWMCLLRHGKKKVQVEFCVRDRVSKPPVSMYGVHTHSLLLLNNWTSLTAGYPPGLVVWYGLQEGRYGKHGAAEDTDIES